MKKDGREKRGVGIPVGVLVAWRGV